MTPQQMTTLVTALRASQDPVLAPLVAARNDWEICKWCNQDASPVVKAWRKVTPDLVTAAVDMSELDGLTQGKRDAIVMALQFFGGFDATKASGLKAITDCFPNTGAPNSRTAMLAIAQEPASNAEVLVGGLTDLSSTGAGATTAKVRSFVGDVDLSELSRGLNAG